MGPVTEVTETCRVCGAGLTGGRFCNRCGAIARVEAGADPLLGRLLGERYRVMRVIGEGGMGVVYEGQQVVGGANRRVAIKTLREASDPLNVARFYRECEMLAGLAHPNTVRIYDFGETPDGVLYLVMEYVDGQSLNEALEQGPFSAERASRVVSQIAQALGEAHAQGLIHRDLKPDNIYLIKRGQREVVKLLDFGIARRSRPAGSTQDIKLTRDGSVLGTPPYMSPEQFTEQPVDQRSDIYSLAVIAYELLTGELPYGNASTPWEWATRHMTAEPRHLQTLGFAVDPSIEQAIFWGLSKDPDERPATVGAFARALDQAVKGNSDTVDSARLSASDTARMRGAPGVTAQPTQRSDAKVPHPALAYAPAAALPPLAYTPIPAPDAGRRRSRLPGVLVAFALLFGGATLAVAYDQGMLGGSTASSAPTQLTPAAQLTVVEPLEAEPPEPSNQSLPPEPQSVLPTPTPYKPGPAPVRPAPEPAPTTPGVVLPLPIPTLPLPQFPPATPVMPPAPETPPTPPPAPTPAPTPAPKPPVRPRLPGLKPLPRPSATAPQPAPSKPSRLPNLGRGQ